MTRFLAVILAVAILVAPRIADACGVWHMQDVDKKLDIDWLINAGSIHNTKTRARIAALYLDTENKTGMRVVKDRKVIFDYADGKIRKYGKPVATLETDTITFGKKVYTYEFTNPHDFHGMPGWTVTVKLGDKLIIESKTASALCAVAAKPGMVLADQRHEIRLRMAFYLAWREVGA